jgi:hypothetical protein
VLRRRIETAADLSEIADGAVFRTHMMLACDRIRRKRDGLGVRHASQGVMRGASDAGESPWRRLRERAEKIPGDKKHDPGLTRFSHRVIALRSSIQHRNARFLRSSR